MNTMGIVQIAVLGCLVLAATAHPRTRTLSSFSLRDDDVTYHLFTRANPTNPVDFKVGSVETAGINPALPFKILSHGWQDSVDSGWYAEAISEYLKKGDYNVIAIDWSGPAGDLYWDSVDAAYEVAEVNARFIVELNEKLGVAPEDLHLIGHSLGAHIFGLTGQNVLGLIGRQVGRVTGLDPAGPWWNGNSANQRLSPDDAIFVDAIHTDGNFLGYGDRLADADFYPNGGTASQNGCGFLEIGCSHNRAPTYFIESINSPGFVAIRCDSNLLFSWGFCNSNAQAVMGEDTPISTDGAFYFNTNNASPYARGLLGL